MKNCKLYQKYIYFGQNTSLYCSQIIVGYVIEMVFSRVHQVCHNIAHGIKPGSNSLKGPPGVLGIWGEWLFVFRGLGSTGNYLRRDSEQAHNFGDIGSLAKK